MRITIEIIVDGTPVTGKITHRSETDIGIAITSPYNGYCTGSHIPILARGARPGGFTGDYGDATARILLQRLYRSLHDIFSRWEELREAIKPYQQQVADLGQPITRGNFLRQSAELRRQYRSGEIDLVGSTRGASLSRSAIGGVSGLGIERRLESSCCSSSGRMCPVALPVWIAGSGRV